MMEISLRHSLACNLRMECDFHSTSKFNIAFILLDKYMVSYCVQCASWIVKLKKLKSPEEQSNRFHQSDQSCPTVSTLHELHDVCEKLMNTISDVSY